MDNTPEILENFPTLKRGFVGNLFLTPIRAGFISFEGIKKYLAFEVQKRKRYGGNEILEQLFQLFDDEELQIREAINYYIDWHNLKKEERASIKMGRSQKFINSKMSTEPPTEKQLNYLLWKKVETIPKTKLEASQMISRLKEQE